MIIIGQISRFIPHQELVKYKDIFDTPTFTKVMDNLNLDSLGEPKNTDILKVRYSPNSNDKNLSNYTLTEVSKLIDFGNKAQVILKHYEANLEQKKDIIEIVQIWRNNENNFVFKEYAGGELYAEDSIEEIPDVYTDYIKVPEVSEEYEELLVELMYDPLSCIRTGSCCIFEGQRYEHCGQTCGIHHNAGGGTAINSYDSCCRTHDIEIRGKTGSGRCNPHRNFIRCTNGLKAPGDTTMRNGIRADALVNGCGFI